MDSKQSLNMGSTRATSVFMQLDSVLDRVGSKIDRILLRGNSLTTSIASNISKLGTFAGGMAPAGTQAGGNTIMNQPPVYGPQLPGMPSIMPGGGGGQPGDIRRYLTENSGKVAYAGAAVAAVASPSTQEAVSMDYFLQRSRFLGAAGQPVMRQPGDAPSLYTGAGTAPRSAMQAQLLEVARQQRFLANQGTVTDPLDAARGLLALQGSGLGTSNQMLSGVGMMSSLTPGVGVERSAQAALSMQAPRNVNMLRFMGIQARDPITGAPKDPKDIAEQIWQKITREKMGDEPLTIDDVNMSLLPGNSLDSMLNIYFGNDEVVKSQIANYIRVKASGIKKVTKKALKDVGATTGYITSKSRRDEESMRSIQYSAAPTAMGAAGANVVATGFSNVVNAVDRVTAILAVIGGVKGFTEGIGAIGNAVFGKIGSIFGGGKAEGGPVTGAVPYLVGERGPELFVPKVDGTIIPNHNLPSGMTREGGGDVSSMGAKLAGSQKGLSNDQLRMVLEAAGFKGKNIDLAMKVVRAESGGRPGALNPDSSTGDYSMGIFQINMIGELGRKRNKQYLEKYSDIGYKGPESLYDPYINAVIAKDLSGGKNFTTHWATTSKKLGLTKGVSDSGPTVGFSPQTGDYTSFKDFLQQTSPHALQTPGQAGGMTTNNNVTINITGAGKNAKEIAKEVKKILDDPSSKTGQG